MAHVLRKGAALSLMLWCLGPAAYALDAAECLVVYLKSGSAVSYQLQDRPAVTYDGPLLTVKSLNLSDDYSIGDVARFAFEKKTVGVETVETGETRILVAPGEVVIMGLAEGAPVAMSDVQGRMLASVSADGAGVAAVSTEGLPAGVYIITAAGRSFKIFRR